MNNSITIDVVKLTQPIGEFYIGSVSAEDLVNISYADVRRIEGESRAVESYLGIQRPLDKNRVRKIKEYLESPDATFPTGVIIAVDQRCATYDEIGNKLILNEYISDNGDLDDDSIPLNKIAKVLDGQHRIHAFMNDDGSLDIHMHGVTQNFKFNVIIFIGLDVDEQANIFATVNLAQTKVNKSLVYDLDGLSKTRSPFKSCHQIAVALDSADESSPLYHRVKRLGVKTKGRDSVEPLTQAVFVESLIKFISHKPNEDRNTLLKGKKLQLADLEILKKYPFRNMFIQEKEVDIALILYNYFSSIRNTWPNAWMNINTVGNILPKSNAFKAFMRFLKKKYIELVGENIGRVVSIEEFESIFSKLTVTDGDFTSGHFKPGSGGESDFYKLLTEQITINDLKQ